MEDRTRRIIETAIRLAERDGYEAVRLRDVADQANVALGTVYRRFRSKQDILVVALEHETRQLIEMTQLNPIQGNNEIERLRSFFRFTTRWLVRKPHLARALLRAVASGEPELTEKVARFHGLISQLILGTMYGPDGDIDAVTPDEEHLSFFLQKLWFAELVGWAGGLNTEEESIAHMDMAVSWMLRGLPSKG